MINNPNPYPEFADIETASEDYARRFHGKVGEFFLAVQTQITLDLLKPWPQATVLDVGGGHGQIARPLVQNGYQVTVVGSSPLCRERLNALLPAGSFTFQSCNLLALPFKDRSFDIVVSFRLLPHLDQWPELIAEMCRVADQAIIIDYPDICSFNFISKSLFGVKKAVEGNTRPFRCFSRADVSQAFTKNHFSQPVFHPEFFIPMAIHRALKSSTFSRVMESVSHSIGLTRLWGSPIILRVIRKNLKDH